MVICCSTRSAHVHCNPANFVVPYLRTRSERSVSSPIIYTYILALTQHLKCLNARGYLYSCHNKEPRIVHCPYQFVGIPSHCTINAARHFNVPHSLDMPVHCARVSVSNSNFLMFGYTHNAMSGGANAAFAAIQAGEMHKVNFYGEILVFKLGFRMQPLFKRRSSNKYFKLAILE